MAKYWVSMTDKFMSGWGKAQNKINKFVIECEDYDQAVIIRNSAEKRSEMKYVNICMNKPRYDSKIYLVSSRRFEDLGKIWTNKKENERRE